LLCIKSYEEEEFGEMVAANMCFYLNNAVIEMVNILKSDRNIEYEELFKYHNIDDTQGRLIDKYDKIKERLECKDPKLVSDNGFITQVISHKKFCKSMVFWLTENQQFQYQTKE